MQALRHLMLYCEPGLRTLDQGQSDPNFQWGWLSINRSSLASLPVPLVLPYSRCYFELLIHYTASHQVGPGGRIG